MIQALVNGQPRDQVSILDRGFQFGDGLFETMAVVDARPCLWDCHLDRLQRGCKRLGIDMPDPRQLEREAIELLAGRHHAVLKIIVTRGESERGYLPPLNTSPTRVLSVYDWEGPREAPLRVEISSYRLHSNPDLAGIKHLNRLEQVQARRSCSQGIDEALMLDHQGRVVEGIMSNLFLQYGQSLVTPSLDDCGVEGVVRQVILDRAMEEGIQVEITHVTLEDILRCDALYLSNSLLGIRPVNSLLGHDWQPREAGHPLLENISETIFN